METSAKQSITSAHDIARYLIRIASQDEVPKRLTPLHVQKLLYYVQGWGLARLDRPVFDEDLEAWRYGPVCPSVYAALAQYEDGPIPDSGEPINLQAFDASFVEAIWHDYRRFSAGQLVDKTHSERPWLVARGRLPEDAPSRERISPEVMADYFREQLGPGIDPPA